MNEGLAELITLASEAKQNRAKLSKKDEALLTRAYQFALRVHEGQKRKNGDPYFSHVLATAKTLAKLRMGTVTIAAGLLHDTLEDTSTTEEDLQKEFGEEILFLVKAVTKLGTLKYRGSERHVESLRRFFVAMAKDLRVVIIKFADRLHNLKTLEALPPEKQQRMGQMLLFGKKILRGFWARLILKK